jgi:predicted naringenin-chalcone synthase
LSSIVSIGTAVPEYLHKQDDILEFMQRVYAPDDANRRKLRFLYRQGGIETRYSAIPDYSLPAAAWQFYPATENLEPFPSLELRMKWFAATAAKLSCKAIEDCLGDRDKNEITHLITVSCTGMSAPGLDLEVMEMLGLSPTINRSSINFMGCYAAIHAMKMADAWCHADPKAKVLLVCTELCTLHFQKEATVDNITSSMLFSDGAAAMLISANDKDGPLHIDHFYSRVALKGKADMAWELSSQGFQMTLSAYIADLIGEDFSSLVSDALTAAKVDREKITDWCIHPGGNKILETVHTGLGFTNGQLQRSYDVLREYGNMSSPTVLFVLKKIMDGLTNDQPSHIFGAAFGPGLTMETFILSS